MAGSPAGRRRAAPSEATPSLLKSSRSLPWQHYVSACERARAAGSNVTMDTRAASASRAIHGGMSWGTRRRGAGLRLADLRARAQRVWVGPLHRRRVAARIKVFNLWNLPQTRTRRVKTGKGGVGWATGPLKDAASE